MNIALIGMMGSGKTSIGKILANKLSTSFIDTDEEIVRQEQKTINEIFEEYGENHFRSIESEILKNILNNDEQVISTGGGIIKSSQNISILKEKSLVIYLKASSDTLFERVKNNKERPLLNVDNMKEKIENLLKERISKYEQAHYSINTENKTLSEIADEIIGKINEHSRS